MENNKIHSFQKKEFNIHNHKFTLDWENNVETEFRSYQYLSTNFNLPLHYLAFPWALLIDIYINKFYLHFETFYQFLQQLNLLDLPNIPFITTIQSYHFKKYLSDFQKIGIKYIFSPHITKNEFLPIFYTYGIQIYPYYIYPSITSYNKQTKNLLYNFIGNINYKLTKPTEIRNNITNLNHLNNSIIKPIKQWHFNNFIYSQQLNILANNETNDQKIQREMFYQQTMEKSIFSICPLGVGPNSIRLWESFTYNTIPISISDDLWLPFYINVNWNDLILNIKEDNYQEILTLDEIKKEQINSYQQSIEKFNQQYLNNFGSIINSLFDIKKINLLIPWYNITDKIRYQEIHQCLENNINNQLIENIILFYETDDINNIKFNLYQHPKIKIVPVITKKKRDISFNLLAKYANQNLINQYCIISNNDIYFDNTLEKIYQIKFIEKNLFVSLTRKNVKNYLDCNGNIWKPHSASQDTWIFISPIKLMNNEINLGWIQCDNIISADYQLNYNVVNPHYDINCWHLHQYNNTQQLLNEYNYNYQHKMTKIDLQNIYTINNTNYQIKKIIKEIVKPKIEKKINLNKLKEMKKKYFNSFNTTTS